MIIIAVIVFGVIGFAYKIYGFSQPDVLAIGETFEIQGCEMTIDDAVVVPAGSVQSFFNRDPSAGTGDRNTKRGLDLTVTVKNVSTEEKNITDMYLTVDQVNDSFLLKLLHLHNPKNKIGHFYHEDFMDDFGRSETIILKPENSIQLHYIFFCFQEEKNQYVLEADNFLNDPFRRQIEARELEVSSSIETDKVSLCPLCIYEENGDYGISLKVTNHMNDSVCFKEVLEIVAIYNKIW